MQSRPAACTLALLLAACAPEGSDETATASGYDAADEREMIGRAETMLPATAEGSTAKGGQAK